MSQTLNQMIASAILGGEEAEAQAPVHAEVITETLDDSPEILGDVEKIASALEFMGRRGIASLLEKTAWAPENDMNHTLPNHTQKQVGHNAMSSPMKVPPFGKMPNNAGSKPGLPAPSNGIDTSGTELGTHSPSLASNQAAIDFTKKVKAREVAPALGRVLDAKAFADPKLKENLSHTSGDKNIKTAHDAEAVRAELARRVAGGRNS